MITLVLSFFKNESGATAIEYALVAGGISILIVAGARSIGTSISGLYINKVANNLT